MLISMKAVFLGQKEVSVKRQGKEEKRLLGKFHQPKQEDNSLISVVLPLDAKLEQYQEYSLTGKLNSWVFNSQVMSRIEAIDFKKFVEVK